MKLPRGIHRRGDSLVVSFADKNGKIIRRALGPVSLSYAVEQLGIFKRQVREGNYEPKRPRVKPEPAPEPVKFAKYVESVYLPWAKDSTKPSTHAAYVSYWKRYLKSRADVPLKDVTVKIISGWLEDISNEFTVNIDTLGKVRSILSGIFTHALAKGDFPGKSAAENPACGALLPQPSAEKRPTKAASREEVRAILAALKNMPLERAAVAICSMLGLGPAEARGLRWSDWDRAKQQIYVQRNFWRNFEGSTKTEKRVRFVAVTAELRELLLALWKVQGSPLDGYILAAPEDKKKPVILDNLARRTIRPRLEEVNKQAVAKGEETVLSWPGWYSFRRFHGTAVCAESDLETTSRALGNSKDIANKHYVKPGEVMPDVRVAVNAAVSGLTA